MSWLGDAYDWTKGKIGSGLKTVGLNGYTEEDQAKLNNLNSAGSAGMGFADSTQGNYNNYTNQANGALSSLLATANGQNSVAAEQLRQGAQSNMTAQRGLAASASPANQAMAARGAVNNIAKLNYGLSGQQAEAGLKERQQAQQAYGSLLGTLRGQDLQGTLGGYQTAVSAYGGGLNGQASPTLAGQLGGIIGTIGSLGNKGK